MGEVADSVRAELEQLGVEEVAPGLAEIALSLARAMDDSDAPTSRAVVGRELRATMLELRKVAPPAAEKDGVDELNARRAQRLSG